jgi:hypothetical protein
MLSPGKYQLGGGGRGGGGVRERERERERERDETQRNEEKYFVCEGREFKTMSICARRLRRSRRSF